MMHVGTGAGNGPLAAWKWITSGALWPVPAARGRTATAPDKVSAEYPPPQRPSSANGGWGCGLVAVGQGQI